MKRLWLFYNVWDRCCCFLIHLLTCFSCFFFFCGCSSFHRYFFSLTCVFLSKGGLKSYFLFCKMNVARKPFCFFSFEGRSTAGFCRLCGLVLGKSLMIREYRSTVWGSMRYYGAAPSRVRPVETVREHAWRQNEREVSASLLIVLMVIAPLWMVLLSHSKEAENESE